MTQSKIAKWSEVSRKWQAKRIDAAKCFCSSKIYKLHQHICLNLIQVQVPVNQLFTTLKIHFFLSVCSVRPFRFASYEALHSGENGYAVGQSLFLNRPNPFRDGLTLEYESAGGMTLVQILDTSGRIVAVPVSTWQARGQYQEYWDAGALPPGTYFCRLVSGGQQQTKTVVKVG